MLTTQLYHPKASPEILIPGLFISSSELHKMSPSGIHIVRTLAPEFNEMCHQLSDERAKVVIQRDPEQTHWRVHVIMDGKVGTSSTINCNLIQALDKARRMVTAQFSEAVSTKA